MTIGVCEVGLFIPPPLVKWLSVTIFFGHLSLIDVSLLGGGATVAPLERPESEPRPAS